MQKKKRKTFNAEKTKKNAILIGVVSLLVLAGAITAAVLLGRKNAEEEPSSQEPSYESEVSEQTESSEESNPQEESVSEPFTLSGSEIPDAVEPTVVSVLPGDQSVFGKYVSYDGELPLIADVSHTADSRCIALILYEVNPSDNGTQIKYEYRVVDTVNRCFGDPIQEEWVAFSYDKNNGHQSGQFGIEYDNPQEKRGPYAIYYQIGDQRNVLCYGEDAGAYARLLRRNDFYAVYSLNHDDENEYFVIDNTGKTVYELGWDADIAFCAPLMFYRDFLVCKNDTDDDSVYDSVSVIDLKDGSARDLVSVGNCNHWNYSSDGGLITMFGCEDEKELIVFRTEDLLSGKTDGFRIAFDTAVSKAEAIGCFVYAVTEGEERTFSFVYYNETKQCFSAMTVSLISEDAFISYGEGSAAVLDNGILTICKA